MTLMAACFPNGRCPPKCNCDDLFWYDVIDSIEGPAEDYQLAVREWTPGQPCPTSHPKKEDSLISVATHTYWQTQAE
jgi:hypothetical protein